jgi:hypothetical protein
VKFYMVVFDRKPDADYRQFHDTFVGHPSIRKWWHYIKSSYIIGTDMSEDQLTSHYTDSAKKHGLPTTHLVMRVVLGESQGMLVKDAWDWITRNS